jgi:hypothetical protein
MMDPLKHCELYKDQGCSHVDGILCEVETCGESIEYYRWKGQGLPKHSETELRQALEFAERKGWNVKAALKKINGGMRCR